MSGGARGRRDRPHAGKERDGEPKRRRLELSGTQVVGAMLATVTGTLFASTLGVLGTVAGAALMSVASTVGTAVYQYYLRRGGDRLRDARHLAETSALRQATRAHRPSVATAQANASLGDSARTPGGSRRDEPVQATLPFPDAVSPDASGDTACTDGKDGEDGSGDDGASGDREAGAADDQPSGQAWRRSWKLYAVMAVGVFALVMGGVTVYEAIVGKPLSSVVNGDAGSGTTLGDLGGGSGSTAPPDEGGTTSSTPQPDSTDQGGDESDTETTPRPDQSTPSDDSSTGGGSGGGSGEPTPTPTTGGQQTPAPGDDGALGDSPGDDGQAPDVVTTPGPAPSAALDPTN